MTLWLKLSSHLIARITSLQEEVKHLKHNLERVEGERKEAQDMLNHSEKVNDLTCTNYEILCMAIKYYNVFL